MNQPNPPKPSSKIRNLGETSSRWLASVNINTIEDLRHIGPVAAYAIVRQKVPQANLNLLWALAAAVENIDWRQLEPARKKHLLGELQLLKANNLPESTA